VISSEPPRRIPRSNFAFDHSNSPTSTHSGLVNLPYEPLRGPLTQFGNAVSSGGQGFSESSSGGIVRDFRSEKLDGYSESSDFTESNRQQNRAKFCEMRQRSLQTRGQRTIAISLRQIEEPWAVVCLPVWHQRLLDSMNRSKVAYQWRTT
jgi:hypothetical protein